MDLLNTLVDKGLRREPLEAKLDPAGSSAERVDAAHGALNVAQLGGTRQEATASDAAKPGDPALDAMAFAPTTPHEAEATSSEVVKSAYDAFEAFKVRRMKSVADSTPIQTPSSSTTGAPEIWWRASWCAAACSDMSRGMSTSTLRYSTA